MAYPYMKSSTNGENNLSEEESIEQARSSGSETEMEYCFESDALALKNNLDYQQLLQCHIKLQAQRTVAVQGLEHLLELWDYGTKNPMQFVEKFVAGQLSLPDKLIPAQLPDIEWSKYEVVDKLLLDRRTKPRTRQLAATTCDAAATCDAAPASDAASASDAAVASDAAAASDAPASDAADVATHDHSSDVKKHFLSVRGRLCDDSKPQSFNQPWTAEEQRRLDELLVLFPPELIAANRYRKIALQLGTRSAVQVQSRVQKYSIALKKNKITLPGYKTPSANLMRKQSNSYRRRTREWGDSRSTFWQPHDTEASMDTATFPEAAAVGGHQHASSSGDTNEESWRQPQELKHGPSHVSRMYCESELSALSKSGNEKQVRLAALVRAKHWKLQETEASEQIRQQQQREQQQQEPDAVIHYTYTCHGCARYPIMGHRFHCIDCSSLGEEKQQQEKNQQDEGCTNAAPRCSASVDYCQQCHSSSNAHHHSSSHKIKIIQTMNMKATAERLIAGYSY